MSRRPALGSDDLDLIVLDDDPTGTQALADVPVLLRWDTPALRRVASAGHDVVHLMTNSRALSAADARRLVGEAARAAASAWPDADVVLRGDSTLRGHLLPEYEAVRDVRFPGDDPVMLLAPALPDAGRITVDGVHLLDRGGRRLPLHETEYAADPELGYRNARLLAWAEERSGGYFRAPDGAEVSLDRLRAGGPAVVSDVLASLAAGRRPAVCVVDAVSESDLALLAAGWADARRRGVPVVLRCAPAFVGVATGRAASGIVQFPVPSGPVLVVCGSYVPATARQLAALRARHPSSLVEADLAALLNAHPPGGTSLVGAVVARLREAGLAVLHTPRTGLGGPGNHERQGLVAQALAAVVGDVWRTADPRPGVVVTKGGVTSAITIRDGLGAARARVVGPVATGVSHWEVETGRQTLPCLVVPGNVGGDDLLVRLIEGLQSAVRIK